MTQFSPKNVALGSLVLGGSGILIATIGRRPGSAGRGRCPRTPVQQPGDRGARRRVRRAVSSLWYWPRGAIKRGDDGSILDTEDPLDTADWYRSDWVQLKILAAGKKMNEVYAISPENKGYAERFRLKLRGFCGIQ